MEIYVQPSLMRVEFNYVRGLVNEMANSLAKPGMEMEISQFLPIMYFLFFFFLFFVPGWYIVLIPSFFVLLSSFVFIGFRSCSLSLVPVTDKRN